MSNAEFQHVFSIGQSKITHAPAGEWSYDAERKSVCGRVTTGVQSYSSGKLIEVTCKSCNKIMDKASDAGFQETQDSSVTVQGAEPSEWVPDMANVPSECFFGCSRLVVAAFSDTCGVTQGVCQDHADRLTLTYYPLPVAEPLPEADMPTVHEALGEPYVMEGRVMIAIPGLFREDGSPVELDEGTERFVITPGYSTQRDCAHMTSIKRYGRRNPNVRVTDLTYVGPVKKS